MSGLQFSGQDKKALKAKKDSPDGLPNFTSTVTHDGKPFATITASSEPVSGVTGWTFVFATTPDEDGDSSTRTYHFSAQNGRCIMDKPIVIQDVVTHFSFNLDSTAKQEGDKLTITAGNKAQNATSSKTIEKTSLDLNRCQQVVGRSLQTSGQAQDFEQDIKDKNDLSLCTRVMPYFAQTDSEFQGYAASVNWPRAKRGLSADEPQVTSTSIQAKNYSYCENSVCGEFDGEGKFHTAGGALAP